MWHKGDCFFHCHYLNFKITHFTVKHTDAGMDGTETLIIYVCIVTYVYKEKLFVVDLKNGINGMFLNTLKVILL